MKISSETTSEEVKKATLENIGKIPDMVITYEDGIALSKDAMSQQYWLNRVCNMYSDGSDD